MPIPSRQNRGADFYCRFLPAKIEDSISIADFQFLRRHFRFRFALLFVSAIVHYHHSLLHPPWQEELYHLLMAVGSGTSLLAAHPLLSPLRHYAAPAPISMITTTHHSCALAAAGGGSTSTAVSHTHCIDLFRGIFADVSLPRRLLKSLRAGCN